MSTAVRTVWGAILVIAYCALGIWIATEASSPSGVLFVVIAIVSLLAMLASADLWVIGVIALIISLAYLGATTLFDYTPFHGKSNLFVLVLFMAGLALAAITVRMTSPKSYGQKPGHH